MSVHEPIDDDFDIADSWSRSVTDDLERSRRLAWIAACVSAAIAVLLAIALVILLPLKEREPYTLLVDRQTGNVEALAPLGEETIAPDEALTRSFLVQYVIARESYDYDDLARDYRRVALWSAGDARQRYEAMMQPGAATNPANVYGRETRIDVEVRSVSSLEDGRSLVRFATSRGGSGLAAREAQQWVAVIDHAYSNAAMREEDRYLNPLGFQVTRYRRDAETLPNRAVMPVPVVPPPPPFAPGLPPDTVPGEAIDPGVGGPVR